MGLGDKISNKAEELKGKAKEGTADAKNDSDLKAEGKADQTSAKAKQAGEEVKDAWKNATD
ncbi:CsbD family protein [Brevibacterium yomogidense]|uniref:CsbD family protein n=1 Tax=Brevibacterium yomogidense TaxID=946573 RepID=UPI0018DFC681|nr:CsbD family protein [Brevibacterium yomogidense]